MIAHVPTSWKQLRFVSLRWPVEMEIAFSGVYPPGAWCRRTSQVWFLRDWRLRWDSLQLGIVINTPVCRLEIVRTWIPF